MGRHEVRWCFHTTAMVADYEATRDALVRLVGLRVLEDSRIEVPAIGRRGGLAWVGDNCIEIGEPIVEGGAVDRFVRRFGPHMSSVAVQVRDLDATLAYLDSHGVRVGSHVDDIVFTIPSGTAGLVIEWFGAEDPHDPHFGASIPPPVVEPVLEVTQMAFAGAVVDDPVAAARRLSELLGLGITFLDARAPAGFPQAGVSLGDMTLALYPLPEPDDSERLWGWVYERAQTSCLGVRVADLAEAQRALAKAEVRTVRDDGHGIVIHPDETGGVVLVVVDALLANDPRRRPAATGR